MSTLEQLGALVCAGAGEKLSAKHREAIRLHVADTLCAWVAGAQTHEGRDLLKSAAKGGLGPFGEGLLARVMLRCSVTRLSEIDDIHLAAGTTPGAVIVPVALTLAEELGYLNRQTLEQGIAGGYDFMVRFGEAMGGASALYKGIWPTYFNAPLGAAAVSARLLGLDATQCAHALALALVLASPNVGQQSGKIARWLLLGHAARAGVMGALAARDGFSGDLNLLDKSFHTAFGLNLDAPALLAALKGSPALLEVAFKPWCAARQTMAAAQGLKEMLQQGLRPEEISAIRVGVPSPYLAMVNHGVRSGDRTSYITSLPYQLALVALAPEYMSHIDHAPVAIGDAYKTFLTKISVEADDDLMCHYPRSWPARIRVSTPTGSRELVVTDIPGDPAKTFDEAQVSEKFSRVLAPLLGDARAAGVRDKALVVLEGGSAVSALLADIARCSLTP